MQSLAFCGRAGASKAGGHTLPVVCEPLFADIFTRHPGVNAHPPDRLGDARSAALA
jgi:hypothetical protein